MRTIGGMYHETTNIVADSLKELIELNRPSSRDDFDEIGYYVIKAGTYDGGTKNDDLGVYLSYSLNGDCEVLIGEDDKNEDRQFIFRDGAAEHEITNDKIVANEADLNKRLVSAVSDIFNSSPVIPGAGGGAAGKPDIGKFSFVVDNGSLPGKIEDLPGAHSLMSFDDVSRKMHLSDMMHGAYADPVDAKGEVYRELTTGVFSPAQFEKMSGEPASENMMLQKLKEEVPEFGKFFGYDFVSEKPETKEYREERDDLRMIFTVETYRVNPLISEKVQINGVDDSPVRMSIISGMPMRSEAGKMGLRAQTLDIVFHDIQGRVIADFKFDSRFDVMNRYFGNDSRHEFLNEHKGEQMPDGFSAAVGRAAEQLKRIIKSDMSAKLDDIKKNGTVDKDTIRDLDIKVGKVSLAYDFAAREWLELKNQANEYLSVIKGYKDGGENALDSDRITAYRGLKEMVPALSAAFGKYDFYKTELIAATKEARQYSTYMADLNVIDTNREIDFKYPCTQEMFPARNMLCTSIEALPDSYDGDMARWVEKYNESAREDRKIEYDAETKTVRHNGTPLIGAAPLPLEYWDIEEAVDTAYPDEKIFVKEEATDDNTQVVSAILKIIPDEIDQETEKHMSGRIGLQFSKSDIEILYFSLNEDTGGMTEAEIIDKLNGIISDGRLDALEAGNDDSAAVLSTEEKYFSIFDNAITDAKENAVGKRSEDDLSYRMRSLENRRIGGVNLENEKDGEGIQLNAKKEADLKIDAINKAKNEYKADRMESSVRRWERADTALTSPSEKQKIAIDAANAWKNAKEEFLKVETEYKDAKADYESRKSRYESGTLSIVDLRASEEKYLSASEDYQRASDKLEQDKINIRINESFGISKAEAIDYLKGLWKEIKDRTVKMNEIATKYTSIMNTHPGYRKNNYKRGEAILNYVKAGGYYGKDSVITRKVAPLEIHQGFNSWLSSSFITSLIEVKIIDFAREHWSYDYTPKYDYPDVVPDRDSNPDADNDSKEDEKNWDMSRLHVDTEGTLKSLEKDEESKKEGGGEARSRIFGSTILRKTDENAVNGRTESVYTGGNKSIEVTRTETVHKGGTSFTEVAKQRKDNRIIEKHEGVVFKDGTVRTKISYPDKNNPGAFKEKYEIEKPGERGAIRQHVEVNVITGKPDWENPKQVTGVTLKDGTNVDIIRRSYKDNGKSVSEIKAVKSGRGEKEETVIRTTGNTSRFLSTVEIDRGKDKEKTVIDRRFDKNGNGSIKVVSGKKETNISVEKIKRNETRWNRFVVKTSELRMVKLVSNDRQSLILRKEYNLHSVDKNTISGDFILKEKHDGKETVGYGHIVRQIDENGNDAGATVEYFDKEKNEDVVIRYDKSGKQISREATQREGGDATNDGSDSVDNEDDEDDDTVADKYTRDEEDLEREAAAADNYIDEDDYEEVDYSEFFDNDEYDTDENDDEPVSVYEPEDGEQAAEHEADDKEEQVDASGPDNNDDGQVESNPEDNGGQAVTPESDDKEEQVDASEHDNNGDGQVETNPEDNGKQTVTPESDDREKRVYASEPDNDDAGRVIASESEKEEEQTGTPVSNDEKNEQVTAAERDDAERADAPESHDDNDEHVGADELDEMDKQEDAPVSGDNDGERAVTQEHDDMPESRDNNDGRVDTDDNKNDQVSAPESNDDGHARVDTDMQNAAAVAQPQNEVEKAAEENENIDRENRGQDAQSAYDELPGDDVDNQNENTVVNNKEIEEDAAKKEDDVAADAMASMPAPVKNERDDEDNPTREEPSENDEVEFFELSSGAIIDTFINGDNDERYNKTDNFMSTLSGAISNDDINADNIYDMLDRIAVNIATIVFGYDDFTVNDFVNDIPETQGEIELNQTISEKIGDDDFDLRHWISDVGDSFVQDFEDNNAFVEETLVYYDVAPMMENENPWSNAVYEDMEKEMPDLMRVTTDEIEAFYNDVDNDADRVLREAERMETEAGKSASVVPEQEYGADSDAYHGVSSDENQDNSFVPDNDNQNRQDLSPDEINKLLNGDGNISQSEDTVQEAKEVIHDILSSMSPGVD